MAHGVAWHGFTCLPVRLLQFAKMLFGKGARTKPRTRRGACVCLSVHGCVCTCVREGVRTCIYFSGACTFGFLVLVPFEPLGLARFSGKASFTFLGLVPVDSWVPGNEWPANRKSPIASLILNGCHVHAEAGMGLQNLPGPGNRAVRGRLLVKAACVEDP